MRVSAATLGNAHDLSNRCVAEPKTRKRKVRRAIRVNVKDVS
jgi:hypothetical protein